MPSTYTALSGKNPGDQMLDTMWDSLAANDDFFRNPPQGYYAQSTADANITTSSATMVDLGSYTVTFTSQGNNLEISLMGRATSTTARFDFLLDGVSITGDNDALGAPGATGLVSIKRIVAAAAGSHTIKVQWRSTSGTVTWYPAGLGQLYVREI